MKMTWASPLGGKAPVDEGSVEAYKADPESLELLHDRKSLWENTVPLEDIHPEDFAAVFVVGGYGVMWDLVKSTRLQNIVAAIWEEGGVVAGVCHGPAALVDVQLSDGSSLVEDKEVACFSNAEEDQIKRREIVPQTCQDSFAQAGAHYTSGDPWGVHVKSAGRLITGQNPASAAATAEAVVAKLNDVGAWEEKVETDSGDGDEGDKGPLSSGSRMAASLAFLGCLAAMTMVMVSRRQSVTTTRSLIAQTEEEDVEVPLATVSTD